MECEHKRTTIIETPNLIHYGKEVCSDCNRFIKWIPSPESEGERRGCKYSLTQIMNFHKFVGEPFCFFCMRKKEQLGDKETLTQDHIVPIRDGGQDVLENVDIKCSACHKLRHWAELYMNLHYGQKNG